MQQKIVKHKQYFIFAKDKPDKNQKRTPKTSQFGGVL